jgi:hypothetical protein
MRATPARLLLLVSLLAGCEKAAPESMPRDRFIRVNVALRMIPDSAPDQAARRAAVLRRERVTGPQLEQWVRTHRASDIAETWKIIANKVDSARPATPPHFGPPNRPGLGLQPPPDSGGPQDSVIRPGRVRPRALMLRGDTVMKGRP